MQTAEAVLAKLGELIGANIAGMGPLQQQRFKSMRNNGDAIHVTTVDQDGKERGFNITVLDDAEDDAAQPQA